MESGDDARVEHRGAHAVRENEAIMIITAQGQMIRMAVKDVRIIGRSTQGVRLINLDEGDLVVSATSVEPDDEESANGAAAAVEEAPAG